MSVDRYVKAQLAKVQQEYEANRKAKVRAMQLDHGSACRDHLRASDKLFSYNVERNRLRRSRVRRESWCFFGIVPRAHPFNAPLIAYPSMLLLRGQVSSEDLHTCHVVVVSIESVALAGYSYSSNYDINNVVNCHIVRRVTSSVGVVCDVFLDDVQGARFA